MKHVLVLTPYLYDTAPGPRSSIELWEQVLRPAGIVFDYAPFENEALHALLYETGHTAQKVARMAQAYLRRFPTMQSVRDYDAVLVYREAALIGPEVFERIAHTAKVPIIYQLDDPLYVPYRSPSNGYLSYLKCFGKVGRIARIASLTLVNSRQHFDYIARFTSRIRLIPILVDAERYRFRPREASDVTRIGWSGSPTTAVNLTLIRSSLAKLGERPGIELRFIGGGNYDLPGVRFTALPWRSDNEIEELSQLDIGLLPVPETEWTKRKFFMKLIQYMSLGIPPICTPLGANIEVVNHGVNGLFARNDAEWEEGARCLVEDPQLRSEMGAHAAETAHSRYTVQARTEELVDAFNSVFAGV